MSPNLSFKASFDVSPLHGSKWDAMYSIPALPWPPGNHAGTFFLRKVIPVCFAGHFVRFRQLGPNFRYFPKTFSKDLPMSDGLGIPKKFSYPNF